MIDLTWGGWIKGKRAAIEMGLPYIRVQGAENHPFVQAADDFLESQVICAKSIANFSNSIITPVFIMQNRITLIFFLI